MFILFSQFEGVLKIHVFAASLFTAFKVIWHWTVTVCIYLKTTLVM
jgi:hypothetical protein